MRDPDYLACRINWRFFHAVKLSCVNITLATDRAFPVIGARLWNSLPDDITTATSLLAVRRTNNNNNNNKTIYKAP